MTDQPGLVRWRSNGVKIVRAEQLASAMLSGATSRATAFDFVGSGGQCTWIGAVRLAAGDRNNAHHHGHHEVMAYVAAGRGRICWGEWLEFAADISPGDFVYFAPYVPHREINLDAEHPLEFVVVRSDNERIAVDLDVVPVEPPEIVL